MPNWVENFIKIKRYDENLGKKFDDLRHLGYQSKPERRGLELSFNALLPLINPQTKKPDKDYWDDKAAIKMWGTKWSPSDVSEVGNEFLFKSAWNFPAIAFARLAYVYHLQITGCFGEGNQLILTNDFMFDFKKNKAVIHYASPSKTDIDMKLTDFIIQWDKKHK